MLVRKTSVFVAIFVVCLAVGIVNCKRRTGGGNRRYPSSRPAPAPAPAPYRPPSHGSGTVRPLGFDTHQSATVRPLGFAPPNQHAPSAPVGPPKYNAPSQSAPHGSGSGTVRPLGFDPHNTGSSHSGQHIGPPKQNSPTGQNPPAYNPAGYGPPAYNPAGYGPPPPYSPGQPYNPQSGFHPQGSYHPQGGYQPNYHPGYQPQGGNTVINNNINNHHYGGYGGGYGGFGGYSPPSYTSSAVGTTALGFFLGYSLAKITTPSFLSPNINGNGPRYDHYEVHHYYHNKDHIPQEATIQPNAIIACVGDSGSFCPANTTSLCTNNGAVMCVASAISTVPCTENKQTNCVKSTIPCKDNKAPECKDSNQDKAAISIPCISTAKIYGDVSYVNNSIVVSNYTTNNTSSLGNNATSSSSMPNYTVTTEANQNITTTEVAGNVSTTESSANLATAVTNITANNSSEVKNVEPQMFCVTILALPAQRKLTEGEIFMNQSKNIFNKFVVKSFGID
ncbi:hypothetical protein NQ317_013107 [Molorchus minor]|uniref:Uncharacterized protein n=1 Tax=Molorchus minor TaxID=1323400 RepID=A0ABQ9JVL4_9CUCU|nr:hypothetical protein NQ317_013107 [Molorchus minor]